ncbi:MAG: hypothetical protein D6797_01155 [Bdellovibrio sp.]|nr:MAG: hypothetical protein D6797_01155 [Bdellovibrio sp.]
MRGIWIIAQNTFKEMIRDRILYGLLIFALLLIGFSLALGQLSFTEQVRISANFGFLGIHLSTVMLAIFLGGSLVVKEIDKKTILTLLVKPITRTQFLLGKSLGLILVMLTGVLGLGSILFLVLWMMSFDVGMGFIWGLLGILMEATLILSMSLCFSTFARPVTVASGVLGLFLIGHWLESLEFFIKKSDSVIYKMVGKLMVSTFPDLEVFNWRSLVIYHETVSTKQALFAVSYLVVWVSIFMLIASFIFSRKDLG